MRISNAIAAAVGLALLALSAPPPAHSAVVFSRDQLTAQRTVSRAGPLARRLHPAGGGGSSVGWNVAWRGEDLCGRWVGALLFPDQHTRHDRFYCPSQVAVLGSDALLVLFSQDDILARVSTRGGALTVQRIDVSPEPRRNTIRHLALHPVDAGTSRLVTAWHDTLLLRHAPFAVVSLGEGHLIDIDAGVAWLVIEPTTDTEPLRPDRMGIDAQGTPTIVRGETRSVRTPLAFRAVRADDGRELARLDLDDPCLTVPRLALDSEGFGRHIPDDAAVVAREALPEWRAATLDLVRTESHSVIALRDAGRLTPVAACAHPAG